MTARVKVKVKVGDKRKPTKARRRPTKATKRPTKRRATKRRATKTKAKKKPAKKRPGASLSAVGRMPVVKVVVTRSPK